MRATATESLRTIDGYIDCPGIPDFTHWFTGSQVVDQNGRPLKLYHQASCQFTNFDDRFDSGLNDFGKAFYFSNSSFNTGLFGSGKLRDLITVHLCLKHPLDFNRVISKRHAVQLLKEYNNSFAVRITPDFHGPLQVGELLDFIQEHDNASYGRLQPFMVQLGYDGFKHYANSYTSFITQPSSDRFVTYAAFRPEQIRFVD